MAPINLVILIRSNSRSSNSNNSITTTTKLLLLLLLLIIIILIIILLITLLTLLLINVVVKEVFYSFMHLDEGVGLIILFIFLLENNQLIFRSTSIAYWYTILWIMTL